MSRFFCFDQNNSGGSFVFDEQRGLTHNVVVEAVNADDANNRAEAIGIYFNGEGDCPCCGNRWYWAYGEGDKEPMHYGMPVAKAISYVGGWMDKGKEICVHYMDGRKEWYGLEKVTYEEHKRRYAELTEQQMQA